MCLTYKILKYMQLFSMVGINAPKYRSYISIQIIEF